MAPIPATADVGMSRLRWCSDRATRPHDTRALTELH
jgi:hypothetical protein